MSGYFDKYLVDASGNPIVNTNSLSYRNYIKSYRKLDSVKSGSQKIRLEVSLGNISNENIYSDFSIWISNPDKLAVNSFIASIQVELNGKQIDQITNPEVQLTHLAKVFATDFKSKPLIQGSHTVIPLYGLLGSNNVLNWSEQKIVINIEFTIPAFGQDSVNLYANKYYFTDISGFNPFENPFRYLHYTNQIYSETVNTSNIKLRLEFNCLAQSLYLWADGSFDRTNIKNVRLHFDGCEYLNLTLDQLDYLSDINNPVTAVAVGQVATPILATPIIIKFTQINQRNGLVDFSKIGSTILSIELKEKCEIKLNVVALGLIKI